MSESGSSASHRRAVSQRQSVERSMGQRWNDVVYRAIDRMVLKRVVEEERVYLSRLDELERVHQLVRSRVETVKHSRY